MRSAKIGQISGSADQVRLPEADGRDHPRSLSREFQRQIHYSREQRKLMQLQKKTDGNANLEVIEKYYR